MILELKQWNLLLMTRYDYDYPSEDNFQYA